MKRMLILKTLKFKITLLIALLLVAASISTAQAYDRLSSYHYSQKKVAHNKYLNSKQSYSKQLNYKRKNDFAQKQYRSRSSVIEEVKNRYNAKVLKISLNEKAGVYHVRVLMPNGKVRSLQISAGG